MKAIYSPYSDNSFNDYLLNYCKERLTKRSLFFSNEYVIEDSSDKSKTIKFGSYDIINSLKRDRHKIYFSNQKFINHALYDLNQRFWYEELNFINNIIHKLYLQYKRQHD